MTNRPTTTELTIRALPVGLLLGFSSLVFPGFGTQLYLLSILLPYALVEVIAGHQFAEHNRWLVEVLYLLLHAALFTALVALADLVVTRTRLSLLSLPWMGVPLGDSTAARLVVAFSVFVIYIALLFVAPRATDWP